jgi:hypothetical protein
LKKFEDAKARTRALIGTARAVKEEHAWHTQAEGSGQVTVQTKTPGQVQGSAVVAVALPAEEE